MKKIIISDVSLRNYGREIPLTLSFKEKLEIARKLTELNIDVIELGPVLNNKADEVLIKTICAVSGQSIVSCAVGYTEQSIEKNFSLISNAKKKRLVVSMPVSTVQMEYNLKCKPKVVLEKLKALTEKAVSLCQEVEVSLEDATRADTSFLYQAIKIAIEAGAKIITLTDLVGTNMPEDTVNLINGVVENVPEIKSVKLAVQCSNAFGMGITNSISVISIGVDMVKVSSISGFNLPSTESFARAMEHVVSKKGYTTNLNTTAIHRIQRQIERITAEKGAKGTMDYALAEDNREVKGDLTIEEMNKVICDLGYELSIEDLNKVYSEYTRVSTKKTVNTKDLEVIIANTAMQVPESYSLVNFFVNTSNVISSTASVVLSFEGKELSGLSFGNGSIDSAILAIENAIGKHFELDDFQVNSVSEGKEAMGEALVKLRNNGKVYSGRGISTDVVGASIRAYINALNKIVYEENN